MSRTGTLTGCPWVAGFAAVGVALLAAYLGFAWERAYTPQRPGLTVAELLTVPLNGQDHFVTIRSRIPIDSDDGGGFARPGDDSSSSSPETHYRPIPLRPILLVLHGGPGASDIPHIHETDDVLERHFIVVHYDQRSAGKSCRFYNETSGPAQLTIQQHVDDAVDLVEYLRARFREDRIYLLGGSWGSALALLLARDHPQLFHHVAVRGLVVNMERSERLSWDFVRSKYPEVGETIIPNGGPLYDDRVSDLVEQRKWLNAAGGMSYHCSIEGASCTRRTMFFSTLASVLASPEFSWGDLARFESCLLSTLRAMWPEFQRFNAFEQVPSLEVPLLVLQGRQDYCTVHSLVPGYLDAVGAMKGKKLVWFDESGHSPHREEPAKFQRVVVEELLGPGWKIGAS